MERFMGKGRRAKWCHELQHIDDGSTLLGCIYHRQQQNWWLNTQSPRDRTTSVIQVTNWFNAGRGKFHSHLRNIVGGKHRRTAFII